MIKKLEGERKDETKGIGAFLNGYFDPGIFKQFVEIGKLVVAKSDVNIIMKAVSDMLLSLTGADSAGIVLFNKGGNIFCETVRNPGINNFYYHQNKLRIIESVKLRGLPVCICSNSFFKKANDKEKNINIPVTMGIPLKFAEKTIGLIFLENYIDQCIFKPCLFPYLNSVAEFLSVFLFRMTDYQPADYRIASLEKELRRNYQFDAIITHHPKMIEILKIVSQVANTDATVLIKGDSGTGKELIARALHDNSDRRNKPFVPINCAAMPENLLESEFFGHVRGAFTGAVKDKPGWFESADGGTIFLDEISEMSMALQVKLLRVLQTGHYSRVGSTEIRQCNVRIVAATTRDLQDCIKEGRFREELFYRLNVIDVYLPALKERGEDIPLLIKYFLKMLAEKYGKQDLSFSLEAETVLMDYDYPGNIRELENVIERAVVLAEGKMITPTHLPNSVNRKEVVGQQKGEYSNFKLAKQRIIERFEKEYIIDCLRTSKGNISSAAKCAGIHFTNFYSKMRKYGIQHYYFK